MKVFVGGALGRYVEPDHHLSILNLLPTIYQRTGHPAIYKPSINDAMLDRARGMCATTFLEKSDADVLLSLDSDVVFEAEDAVRVCEAAMEHSIVGALYITRGAGKNAYPTSLPLDDVRMYFGNDDTPIEFRYVATGFVAVHRRVFEALAKRDDCPMLNPSSARYRFRPFYTPFWYDFLGQGEPMYLSEDWAFPLEYSMRVLGSDYRWRQVGDVQVGDVLLGVDEDSPPHSSRRYGEATVTDRIVKYLPIWRIVTEEGDLLTTAEHPWLVERGWRRPVGYHKTNTPLGAPKRWRWTPTASIQPGDLIARVTPQSANPDLSDEDYQAGYLQGVMQGDGWVAQDQHAGKLAMCDREALTRFEGALDARGLTHTHQRAGWNTGKPQHRQIYGVTFGRPTAEALQTLRMYAPIPSPSFAAGYLAGIFDAEGHFDGATIDIHNRSVQILQRIVDAGQVLDYRMRFDDRRVRMTGIEQVQRFWMETQPAIKRKMSLRGQNGRREAMHRKVRVLAVEPVGRVDEVFCLTTTTGTFVAEGFASHNCDRAAQEGFKSYIDPSVRIQHQGLHPFRLEDMLTEAIETQPVWLTRQFDGLYTREAIAEPEVSTMTR